MAKTSLKVKQAREHLSFLRAHIQDVEYVEDHMLF